MFDILNQAILYLLSLFKGLLGNFGLAIVAVTVLIRVLLWPVNTAQTRSMQKMQAIQPKMKQLQERFKDQPQKLQEAMFKLYAEHKFNPFAGCLPQLVQIPLFIGLYGALNSPEFMATAGNESFWFIDKLHNTLHSYAGEPADNTFNVQQNDRFQSAKVATVTLKTGRTLEQVVGDPNQSVRVEPQPLIPGETMMIGLKLDQLQLSKAFLDRVNFVEIPVMNQNSRELEVVRFVPSQGQLVAQMQTAAGEQHIHWDVLSLILLYGVLMLAYQKSMQKNTASGDPNASKLMNIMLVAFLVTMFIFPIPAGVMIYLVVIMAMTWFQTWWLNRSDASAAAGGGGGGTPRVIDIKPDNA